MDCGIFCCDQISSMPTSSSIMRMADEKIKQFMNTDCSNISNEFEILDQRFNVCDSVTPDEVKHYFCLVKKTINMFRAGITSKRSAPDKSVWTRYRKQIFTFLKFIYFNVRKYEEGLEKLIIKEVVDLITFTGRLSMLEEFDPNIYIGSSGSQSASRQYLHACLDVWLCSFHILCEYNQRTKVKIELLSDVNASEDLKIKFLECLLADLIYVSLQKFATTKDMRMVTTVEPYVCLCHCVFFTIIKILVEEDTAILNIHPFWFYYNAVMDNFSEENRKESNNRDSLVIYKRIPSCFKSMTNLNIASLWLMSNLMELVNTNLSSNESSIDQDLCNSVGYAHSIIPILQDYEVSGLAKVEYMETTLQLCYNSVKKCGICVDIPVLFIECYCKMITSSVTPNTIYYTLPKTSNQWSLKLRTLFERSSASEWDDKTLGLLLLLIEKVISKLSAVNSTRNLQLWQKLKSDLFGALSSCSIERMNESQLYKIFTILIVCCCSSDVLYIDFVEKFKEISNLIVSKSVCSKKTKLLIQWIICSALMLPDDKDMNKLTILAVDIFDKLTDYYSKLDQSNRSVSKESCSELILLYFEEIIYLSEVKIESIGSCSLIPASIEKVFGRLADRDLFNITSSISNVIRSVRNYFPTIVESPFKHSFGPFITNVLKVFMPFVRSQYSKGTIDQMSLCEVASNLTYLSYFKDPGRLNSNEFRYNFFHFTCSSRVDLKQREKFCELLFRAEDSLILKEVCDFLPELTDRYLKSDEAGQARVKTILLKVIIFISNNKPNHVDELFLPKLVEIINRVLSVQNVTKLFRILEIFTSLLPELRHKLVTSIAQRVHEMELEGNKNTADIKNSLRKFYHSSGR